MDREKALAKIRKCLALSTSSEPNEAAAALRQAKALMDMHGLSDADLAYADIVQAETAASGKKTIPRWESILATSIATTMGCKVIFLSGQFSGERYVRPILGNQRSYYRASFKNGSLIFVGPAPRPEIAQYAFDHLRRQLKVAKKKFQKTTRSAKRVEAYVLGWVAAVALKVEALVPATSNMDAIDKVLSDRLGVEGTAKVRGTEALEKDQSTRRALAQGFLDGDDAQLHHGVSQEQPRQLGMSALAQ